VIQKHGDLEPSMMVLYCIYS